MASPRTQPNVLAGPYLDRVAQWRKDEARLQAALADPRSLFVPVWRSRSAVAISRTAVSAYFIEGAAAAHRMQENLYGAHAEHGDEKRDKALGSILSVNSEEDSSELILLGEFRERVCFALEIATETPPQLAPDAELHDLRLIAGELPADEAGLLAYARAMIHWRERHRYCGRCGAATRASQGGHVRVCSDAACGEQQFPRIDPAVIVLVTDGERALLGRQGAWPPGRYSTIAGFVEPGESLEDAVIREVREETGVAVDRIDYHSSQPWPFPASLMLGFTAHAAGAEILLGDDELEDAQWWTREQIARGAVALPTTHSISFRLIEDWYDAGASKPLRDEPGVRMWRSPRSG